MFVWSQDDATITIHPQDRDCHVRCDDNRTIKFGNIRSGWKLDVTFLHAVSSVDHREDGSLIASKTHVSRLEGGSLWPVLSQSIPSRSDVVVSKASLQFKT